MYSKHLLQVPCEKSAIIDARPHSQKQIFTLTRVSFIASKRYGCFIVLITFAVGVLWC